LKYEVIPSDMAVYLRIFGDIAAFSVHHVKPGMVLITKFGNPECPDFGAERVINRPIGRER
jgi:hypothetical protein